MHWYTKIEAMLLLNFCFTDTVKSYPSWRSDSNHAAAYTHKGIVYVLNERSGEEDTFSYAVQRDPATITSEIQDSHVKAMKIIAGNKTKWN